jgi:hypothetical protein
MKTKLIILVVIILAIISNASFASTECYQPTEQLKRSYKISLPSLICLNQVDVQFSQLSNEVTLSGTITGIGAFQETLKLTVSGRKNDGTITLSSAAFYSETESAGSCNEYAWLRLWAAIDVNSEGKIIRPVRLLGTYLYTPDVCHSKDYKQDIEYTLVSNQ